MEYEVCNVSDELEPRVVPKPASRFECLAIPSIPEVSLIMNTSGEGDRSDRKVLQSPGMDKWESYAAWKRKKLPLDASQFPSVDTNTLHARTELCRDLNDASRGRGNSEATGSSKYSRNGSSPMRTERPAVPFDSYNKDQVRTRQGCGRVSTLSSDNLAEPPYGRQQLRDNQAMIANLSDNVNGPLVARVNGDEQRIANNGYRKSAVHCPTINGQTHPNGRCSDVASSPRAQNPYYDLKSLADRRCPSTVYCNTASVEEQSFQTNVSQRYPCHPHSEPEHPYTFAFPCAASFRNHRSESDEMIKNLLQLVNNQSEQIKSLQGQVNRLSKIQERNSTTYGRCHCSSEGKSCRANDDSAAMNSSSNDSRGASRVSGLPQNASKTRESGSENHVAPDYDNQAPRPDDHRRNALLEQKVSIGVMTSFEFTVQNSPFALDSEENYNERSAESEIVSRCKLPSAGEMSRRNQIPFQRASVAQLENIIEDSESYLSSQQPSGNSHVSPSSDDHPERRNYHPEAQRGQRTVEPQSRRSEWRERGDNLSADGANRIATEEGRGCLKTPSEDFPIDSTERVGRENHVAGTAGVLARESSVYNVAEFLPKTPFPAKDTSRRNGPRARFSENPRPYERFPKDPKRGSNGDSPPGTNRADESAERTARENCAEDSVALSGGALEVNERPPPSPEPSIHVEMQEYSSDEESERAKRTPNLGWTFYDNVLGQVNRILQNSPVVGPTEKDETAGDARKPERDPSKNKALMDTVKIATMEQLKKLGISFAENAEPKETNGGNVKLTFDSSYYPRLDYRANMTQVTSAMSETDTSMQMKALALKYLSDEELAELAIQKQGAGTLEQLMLSNVQGTNVSIATMRYLERYRLLPGKNAPRTEGKENVRSPQIQRLRNTSPNGPKLKRCPPLAQTLKTSCPSKILDISTLKQRPKLL